MLYDTILTLRTSFVFHYARAYCRAKGDTSLRRLAFILLVPAVLLLVLPSAGRPADHALSVGYGFGMFNMHKQTGRIEGGKYYDFFQLTYLWERPSRDYRQLALFVEPFAAYVNRPHEGVDGGLYVGLKWYPLDHRNKGLFVTAGTGLAYTTTGFKEQGTHLLFTLEAGVGYRYGRFFVEDRIRHYSNGRTAEPNRAVNANVFSIGFYF